MKYLYWILISVLITWELQALRGIANYSMGVQLSINLLLVAYFGYLLEIPYSKIFAIRRNTKA